MASYPHIYPPGATFFITFRLNDSLPQHLIRDLKKKFLEAQDAINGMDKDTEWKQREIRKFRKGLFGKFDKQLDLNPYGECHMNKVKIASIICDKIKSFHGIYYTIVKCCIMPNHVHMLLDTSCQIPVGAIDVPEDYVQVSKWMQLIKGGSSYAINKELNRSGSLWAESFDHYSRSEEETERITKYIENNPLKAGLPSRFHTLPYMF